LHARALNGRTALVTGASSGLGRHFAAVLCAAGAKVALAARRVERLEAVQAELEEAGGTTVAVAMDVTDRASVDSAVAKATAALGPIDILINNAGLADPQPFLDMSEESWQMVIDTNLTGVWRVSQAVARGMAARGRGVIVNISSVLGVAPSRNNANYSVAKAGVDYLTRLMALELGRSGIRVNAIAPGYIVTDLNQAFLDGPQGRAFVDRLFPKRVAQPSELDGALLLLTSDAGSYINGVTLPVEGGTMLKSL
jgi:NAD(P)-dependent dehydrogenase (short-subunit alcohol dehydrogenase family)